MTHLDHFDYEKWLTGSHQEAEWFTFQARAERIVDGDTLDLEVDLGFQVYRTIRVRLGGLDTNEIYGVKQDSMEYQRGIEQKQFVEDWAFAEQHLQGEAWPFVLTTAQRTGKYGRYIGVLRAKNSNSILNEDLVAAYPDTQDA